MSYRRLGEQKRKYTDASPNFAYNMTAVYVHVVRFVQIPDKGIAPQSKHGKVFLYMSRHRVMFFVQLDGLTKVY